MAAARAAQRGRVEGLGRGHVMVGEGGGSEAVEVAGLAGQTVRVSGFACRVGGEGARKIFLPQRRTS